MHYGDDRTSNTRNLIELLQEADFKQHVREPTHVGDHILDLVIPRNIHNIISSTSVETLLTDHHVIRTISLQENQNEREDRSDIVNIRPLITPN